MPFTMYCGLCLIDYNFIGTLETIHLDLEYIISQNNERLKSFRNTFSKKVYYSATRRGETNQNLFSTLSKHIILRLYKVYELDFLIGGYSFPENFISYGKP